ncbi:Caudovirus, tape measure, N-terminal [uncultured Caudovirales phage]|uniref:Caudovirus, tape measure, N-terminal n=1 Tax=uncultured Caudovirales phage TaxID=2100421 RepID=A0A6J5KPH4_9CAUD|nr:Caudovirus, tape measure, N-terminal [uncultured Caudovirales phage]CAB4123781.1 Caudovirus, tape measure, N-terminal [uncultured Caudovirales phage]
MTDIVQLGFEIDTATLAQAKQSATQLAEALTKVADAADKQAEKIRKATDEEKKQTGAVNEAVNATKKKEDANKTLTDTLGKVVGQIQTTGQAMQGLVGQLSTVSAALGGSGGGGAGGVTGALNAASGGIGRFTSGLGAAGMAAGAAAAGVAALGGAYIALAAATYKAQESYMLIDARLKNVYGSGQMAADVFSRLQKLATENGVAFDRTADSFLRLARNNDSIGLTRAQMVDLTDSVQKLGRISGATQGELASGMMQFSQALSAGRLNGDELRSIFETMPELIKTIADGLGVNVGQIRAMGAEGQLTSDKVTGAILKQLPKITEQFANLPQTSDMAFSRIGNSVDRLVASIGTKIKASEFVTGLSNAIATAVEAAAKVVEGPSPEKVRDQRERQYQSADEVEGAAFPRARKYAERLRKASGIDKNDTNTGKLTQDAYLEYEASRKNMISAYTRASSITQEGDEHAAQVKKFKEDLTTLEQAYAPFRDGLVQVRPEEEERVKKLPEYIAAYKTRLEQLKPVLDDYRQTTADMYADLEKFGAGGATIGADARNIVNSAAGKLQNTTYSDAENEVIRRKVAETNKASASLETEALAQRTLTDAIGKGAAAEREAQIAIEVLNYDLKTFGGTLDKTARDSLKVWEDRLRAVKELTAETADKQRLYNVQLEAGALAAARTALNAGKLPGDVTAARANAETAQKLLEARAGGASLSSVPEGLKSYFDDASRSTGISASILAAIAKTESSFNMGATSSSGARGIMQVLPSTARDPGYGMTGNPNATSDERSNVMFGSQYFLARAQKMGFSAEDLNNNPAALRAALRAYSGADTPKGDKEYDSKVFNNLPTAEKAILGADQNRRESSSQESRKRVLELEREITLLREQQKATTPKEARDASLVSQARKASENVLDPTEREVQFKKELLALQEKDKEDVAAKNREIETTIQLDEREIQIQKLTGNEREIELRVLEEIKKAKLAGLDYDEEGIRKAQKRLYETEKQKKNAQSDADNYRAIWDKTADGIGNALESAFREAVMNGKVDGEKLLKGFIADIGTQIMRTFITAPLVSGLKSMFMSAHGNVVEGGYRLAYAQGGVVSQPTVFPMANGAGLMGEAGPEAVLPLKRGADGRLGVSSGSGGGGGGVIIQVNDMRSASGSQQVETQEQKGPNGERMVSIIVRDEVRKQMKNGEYDGEMRQNYGATRVLTQR